MCHRLKHLSPLSNGLLWVRVGRWGQALEPGMGGLAARVPLGRVERRKSPGDGPYGTGGRPFGEMAALLAGLHTAA